MLQNIVSQFFGLFKTEGDIDDLVFKLHYKATAFILFVSSLLATGQLKCDPKTTKNRNEMSLIGKIYLGDPIECSLMEKDFDKYLPKKMLNSYCYIHATFLVAEIEPDSKVEQLQQIYPGVGPMTGEHKTLTQSYYQWVPLVLLIQVSVEACYKFLEVKL